MFLFEKPEYRETEMQFILDDVTDSEDEERCLIDIEAYGDIDGERKYFYSSFELK